MTATHLLQRMARNNAWATFRLHRAVAALTPAAYRAPRTSFFPSIHGTLVHILHVDLLYLGALEGAAEPQGVLNAEMDRLERDAPFTAIADLQRAADRRLVGHTESLARDERLHEIVEIERADHVQREARGDVLLHLFQHQIHHRGQVHAMLSGTNVPPPQLDELFLAEELPLRRAELEALGLPRE